MLGKEVERLNGVLRGKIDEINTLQLRHQKATEENQHFKKQINVLNEESADFRRIHNRMEELEFELNKERAAKERIAKINSDLLKRQEEFDHSKLEQYEQKTTQLTQEIMRLNGSIITL
jgi:chromosome segregation ATPase